MAECKGSSTKQLKQCLGFWDHRCRYYDAIRSSNSHDWSFCTSSIFDRSCDHDMPVCTARIYSWHRPS